MYSPGWIYMGTALGGGLLFIRKSVALVANPGRKTAMACFHASLVQLSLLIVGAMLDSLLLG